MVEPSFPRVYRMRSLVTTRAYIATALVVIVGGTVTLFVQQLQLGWKVDSWLWPILFATFALIGLGMVLIRFSQVLVLSEKGITRRTPVATITFEWGNVRLRRVRFLPSLFGPFTLTAAKPPIRETSAMAFILWSLGIQPYSVPITPKVWHDYRKLMEDLAMYGIHPS